ncbi:MAG: FAD-dependent monooxygenase [Myxococcales bacterium]|nr:FAD-dependent monooxygenase [Myxococcales bacterium]
MRIDVVGGGPGGLFFAILARKRDPARRITVHERNQPGDTFGWGVVFSELTQENLRAADPETLAAMEASSAHWDAIETHVGGRVLTCRGHAFAGLERRTLLDLLYRRADALGVELRFGVDVDERGLEVLRERTDLLVAADGVHSKARTLWASQFEPSIELHANRYIWLGTPRPMKAFTFVFEHGPHGPFVVHAYPYGPSAGTFIVETTADTFERSGLGALDEAESIAFCERLFARWLAGAPLLGNRSSWIRFRTVRNARWSFDRVVLLGDAAHTAHFSIGSGTRLAMEDAIALVDALDAHPGDVSAALMHYERQRRPAVESLQRAARRSLEWFERVAMHLDDPPERFVFSLLTRSLRVGRESLARRDPTFVEQVDAWWRDREGVAPGAPLPPMFVPFRIRGMTLDNRVVVSPMAQYRAVDGVPGDWHLVHLGARAVGGAGLLLTEMTCVSPEGRITPACTGLWNDAQERAWGRIVEFVHAESRARIGVQLGHAGRKGSTHVPWQGGSDESLPEGGWTTIAPSPIPWGPRTRAPREMTLDDIAAVRRQFRDAAARARRIGFDLVELHFAHGYLVSSFLSPLTNRRTDAYGGPLERRARLALEIVAEVRDVWDGPLSVRISAHDWSPGGLTDDDAVLLARWLADHGVDLIDVSSGQVVPDQQPAYGRAYQTPFAERIRKQAAVPTIAVGAISSWDDVNTIVLAGRADLVALARAHLLDPHFTLRAAHEQNIDDRWPDPYRSARTLRRPPRGL